jgi:hypothetical protein
MFSIEDHEIEQLFVTLHPFICSTEFWQFSVLVCRIFILLHRGPHVRSQIELPGEPIWAIIRNNLVSHCKLRPRTLFPAFFKTFLGFVRTASLMFPVDATEQMLALWRPLLDPNHPKIVLVHGLIANFLPVHSGTHGLWFTEFMHLWRFCRSAYWDYQWLILFNRLAVYDFDDLDWSPHLPSVFGSLSAYVGVRNVVEFTTIESYPTECYDVFWS